MFSLSQRSKDRLEGVHPALVRCVHKAIELTEVDFGVLQGIRTIEQQEEYMRRGVTRTMNSKHLVQPDGFGHAVDLAAYVGSELRWELPLYFKIAEAMKEASILCVTPIRWGGAWINLTEAELSPEVLVDRYVEHKRSQGKSAFIDGPHFELLK